MQRIFKSWPFVSPLLLSALLVGAAVALVGCSSAGSKGGGEKTPCRKSFIEVGQQAPDLTLPGLDGKDVSLRSLTGGKVALVDLWATWCAPCVAAMPHLDELYMRYKDQGFVVVGVMSDDNATKIGPKDVKKRGVSYPMLLDENAERVSCLWGPVMGFPSVVMVDREGKVVETWLGTTGTGEIEERLQQLLAGAAEDKPAGEAAPEAE